MNPAFSTLIKFKYLPSVDVFKTVLINQYFLCFIDYPYLEPNR